MSDEWRTVLAEFEAGKQQLEAAIAGLTEVQMLDASIDGWSVKDHLGHLGVWHELRFLEIERIAAGFQSGMESTPALDEAFNQIAVAWRAPLSLEQVLWELDRARKRVVDAGSSLSEADLARVLVETWPLRTGHESEHAGFISNWRRRRAL